MKLKLRIVFLVVFFFMFSSVFVYADYDITSKYQKTEFNRSKWIQSYHNIILNTTRDLLYLNKTFEDFTLWTENDPNNRLSQTDYDSIFTDLQINDEDTYLYKNVLNEMQNFKGFFTLNITNLEISTGNSIRMHPFILTDGLDDYYDNYLNDEPQIGVQVRSINSDDTYWWYLFETNSTGTNFIFGNNLNVSTEYYFKIKKQATFMKCGVYYDKNYNNLIKEINITLSNNYNFNYLLVPQSSGLGGAFKISGYISKLNIGNYVTDGVLYTENLLENFTGKSVMLGLNSSAVTDTQVRLYTSSDNATWVELLDNDGLGTLGQYSEVLYDYSSLFVRLNLSTVDPLLSPYVDELFYFHTYECAVSSETKPYVFITLFTIIGMILGYAIDRT